ncbi:Hypothetical protein R9X50_00737000 [Acrodontium crateriforme]|uniref:Sister chromatid cohesion protein Dcc1 n=1 Tax=Acrodontium crateriforme TaxID=150365 RepID=A0AAQ3MAX3_9PEZI|nr:Hypothetical protein R9X50_00737000 [Acrodontium crateriforme]
MSSQGGHTAAQFSILPEDQHQSFRLVELPPEILQLLESENPPILYFKSAEGTLGQPKNSTAALCTSDKTYHVRQVNHSNSVFITQSSKLRSENDNVQSSSGIEAIATSGFTLELTPVAKTESATPYLKAMLPLYISSDQIEPRDPITKAQLFADVPFSEVECNQAWKSLTSFESSNPPGCFRPSGKAKIKAWISILTQATATSVDLTASVHAEQMSSVVDTTEDWPVELSYAILDSLCIDTKDGRCLRKDQSLRQLGIWQLDALTQGGRSVAKAEFMSSWSDCLPEKWRSEATLDVLQGAYTTEENGKSLRPVDETQVAQTQAKLSLGAKRKWHEKFRPASKKTA